MCVVRISYEFPHGERGITIVALEYCRDKDSRRARGVRSGNRFAGVSRVYRVRGSVDGCMLCLPFFLFFQVSDMRGLVGWGEGFGGR